MTCVYTTPEEYYGTGLQPLGHKQWFCEIDEEDENEIVEQICNWIRENGELPPKTMTIWLTNPYTDEEIEFEINPYEYMTNIQQDKECLAK